MSWVRDVGRRATHWCNVVKASMHVDSTTHLCYNRIAETASTSYADAYVSIWLVLATIHVQVMQWHCDVNAFAHTNARTQLCFEHIVTNPAQS